MSHHKEKMQIDVKKIFKTGKQGISGLTSENTAFKVSQYINYLTDHEYIVMNRLKTLKTFCPNFCLPIQLIRDVPTEPKPENDIPFVIKSKYPIKKAVLVEEYIKGKKLYRHIKRCEDSVVLSAVKQTLAAITMAQKLNFSHYDLHSDNIILEKCDKDDVCLYVFGQDNHIAIPTFGYRPRIIDYGFSYIDALEDDYFTGSFAYNDVGFTSDRFDWLSDPKLLLITVFNEIKNNSKSNNGKKMERLARNMFKSLRIDWECGWDNVEGMSAIDIVSDLLQNIRKKIKSKIFVRNERSCLDIISTLIILPSVDKSIKELEISYTVFVNEFSKIEDEIKSSQYNLYILKCIVDSAKRCRKEYRSKELRESIVLKFRQDVTESIMAVSKFCSPRNIRYEIMLCALYNLSNCMEGVIYRSFNHTMFRKSKEYKQLPIKSIYDINNIVNINMPDDYIYNKNTNLYVYDSVSQESTVLKLSSDLIDSLNSVPKHIHSFLLYAFYNPKDDRDLQSEDDVFLKQLESKCEDIEYNFSHEEDDDDGDIVSE